ncbi:MAG: cytochrome c [Pseudomonadota bacterium]
MTLKPFVILGAATLAACTLAPAEPDTSAAFGARAFQDKCAVCHGVNGTGAGVASLGLGGPPPDLTGLSARNGGTFPRTEVMSVIDGFNRRSHPETAMPEFGAEGLGQPVQVEQDGVSTPIPAELLALANYLETIQQ